MTLLSILLLLTITDLSDADRLVKFRKEVEQINDRHLTIDEQDTLNGPLGQTFCDRSRFEIQIVKGLDSEVRTQVLAHELGHAYLCGKGIFGTTRVVPMEDPDAEGLLAKLGGSIGSCFVDPLADAEARKRGFDTSQMIEEFARINSRHTNQDVHRMIEKFGEPSSVYTSVSYFCMTLRNQNKPFPFENIYQDEPTITSKLEKLRKDFRNATCSDSVSCYNMTLKLRDEFNLRSYVLVGDPKTGLFH